MNPDRHKLTALGEESAPGLSRAQGSAACWCYDLERDTPLSTLHILICKWQQTGRWAALLSVATGLNLSMWQGQKWRGTVPGRSGSRLAPSHAPPQVAGLTLARCAHQALHTGALLLQTRPATICTLPLSKPCLGSTPGPHRSSLLPPLSTASSFPGPRATATGAATLTPDLSTFGFLRRRPWDLQGLEGNLLKEASTSRGRGHR